MKYTQIINESITYIDEHLCDRLTLTSIAARSGFSKYHFLRIFKNETGEGLSEHIQNRRLAKAAKLLLSTDFSIMEIACLFQYDSQEAFTRAFKKVFFLPPGRYRRAMFQLIMKKESQIMKGKQIIPGWIFTGNTPKAYQVQLDETVKFHGLRSILMQNSRFDLEASSYCTILQQFKAKNFIGKRIRFSGMIKSQEVAGWGGLWMRIDSVTSTIIKIDNMQNRPIRGNTDWTSYSIVLDVPENSSIINIGMLLYHTGSLWLDNISFEVVGDDVTPTDVDLSYDLPEAPVNLSLDELEPETINKNGLI